MDLFFFKNCFKGLHITYFLKSQNCQIAYIKYYWKSSERKFQEKKLTRKSLIS
jgi:hypothetical protein